MSSCIHILAPLTDSRWDELVARHPRASVFHSRGWLDALQRTYGYEPVVLTTTPQGPLENGLVVCRVSTWVSRRLVSLPFSDHCEPLVDDPADLSAMLGWLVNEIRMKRWKSLEIRPRHTALAGLAQGPAFCLHVLDLTRPEEEIFRGFHGSSTQRAIRRAEREGLTYETGRSDRLLSAFYRLLRVTRRRHGLPPQPLAWFRNLLACLGDGLTIRAAIKDGVPVAAILTLSFKTTMVYKYGASDAGHHRLGAMPFLFWRTIQEAQARGIEELDLGRSDLDQPGLIAFKDHLGAGQTRLTYYVDREKRQAPAHRHRLSRIGRAIVERLPDAVLDLTGRVLYRHLG